MSSVRKSLAIAFIERYLLIALSLGSNMLLARLLTPEEIGLYSVNLVFIGIAHMLRDFGISNYVVQAPQLPRTEIRTAFGISLLLGSVLFLGERSSDNPSSVASNSAPAVSQPAPSRTQ